MNWFKLCIIFLLAIVVIVYSWNTWFDNQPTAPESPVRMTARAAGFSQSQADYLDTLERRLGLTTK